MATPTDPFFSQQWHLQSSTGYDLNVAPVWDNYTGAGVRVVVIDDGFDYLHSDLAPNYDTGLDYDFDGADLDPFGTAGDAHGTAVTGIIGADNNGTGAVGIAHDASLVGYRIHGFINNTWLANVRDAIHHSAVSAGADVVNISQGMANAISTVFGAGLDAGLIAQIDTSIGTAVNSGRGGLGTVLVKSAGNSRDDGPDANAIADNYDVNADPWTQDTRQVVVAAVDQDGTVSDYSSYGAANLISAFGTPGEVITTDRTGAAGYNNTDFTFFNGTSAAAPMVTGVVALMFDANPGLGWRDVQNILSYSARHVGSVIDGATTDGIERTPWTWNGADNWNGGGLHFSNDYGYGLVDALAAVRLAETWNLMDAAQTSTNQGSSIEDGLNSAVVIPDGNAAGTNFFLNETFAVEVERVTLTLNFSTTWISDVEVYLTSPDGTTSELIRDIVAGNAEGSNDFAGSWTFESQAFRGESSLGNWTVRIVDDAGGDVLTVSDIVLRTFGHTPSVNDSFIFTNEYSNFAGIGGHSTAVSDLNGGVDVVNAAAVSSASTIRLGGGVSVIDGVALTLANIENAIGGDGADRLYGNASANTFYGQRGNDTLNSGAGNDTLDGSGGLDNLIGGAGNDSLTGEGGNDSLRGDAGNDTLNGGVGHDTLTGGLGTDVMTGGANIDRFDFNAIGESPFSPVLRDTITDFTNIDFIDLSTIDARTDAGGNQAFAFIGSAAFTGVSGQLRFATSGGDAIVAGDVNGDGTGDFQIYLTGVGGLVAADFLL